MLKKTYLIAAAAVAFANPFVQSESNAGDINADIRDGHLFIYGDNDDSSITITSPTQYSIEISGQPTMSGEATTVNGTDNGTVVLTGWTRGIFIYNYGGSDHVQIQDLTSAGPVTVDQGTGDDVLMIGTDAVAESFLDQPLMDGPTAEMILAPAAVNLQSYLLVYAGDGADDVLIRGTYVARTTTVDLGLGDDYFVAGGSDMNSTVFGNNSFIIPSNGADEVVFERVVFEKNLVVDDATGPLMMTAMDTSVAQSAYIYATPDDDDLMAENFNTGDYLLFITEAGNDTVSYSGSNANASFFTGIGHDRIELYDMDSGNIMVQTADGNDKVWLSSSMLTRFDLYGSVGDDFFKVRSTTADEAYVYGASGTDTFETSTLFPNFIDRLRLYSIENETTSVR